MHIARDLLLYIHLSVLDGVELVRMVPFCLNSEIYENDRPIYTKKNDSYLLLKFEIDIRNSFFTVR